MHLAEQPVRAFGFKLRADSNAPARREMFDILRFAYALHRPEQTLLYQLVEQHYAAFLATAAAHTRGAEQAV